MRNSKPTKYLLTPYLLVLSLYHVSVERAIKSHVRSVQVRELGAAPKSVLSRHSWRPGCRKCSGKAYVQSLGAVTLEWISFKSEHY